LILLVGLGEEAVVYLVFLFIGWNRSHCIAPATVSLFSLGFQAATELSFAGCRALGVVSGHRAELARLHGAINS